MSSPSVLGELCEIASGGTPSRARSEFYGGGIPWAKISDLEAASNGDLLATEETISGEGLQAIRGRIFPEGTLLFAIYGSIGKMAFAGRPVSCNQAILGIQNKSPRRLDMRYLFHWLASKRHYFLSDGQGIAQKNLSAGYLRDLRVPLPSLDEQRRIATILDKADALRQKRKRAIALLDNLIDSCVEETFATAPPDQMLGDLFDVQGGLQLSGARAGKALQVPYLRVANVHRDRLELAEIKLMGMSETELQRTELQAGDILFVEGHGNVDEIGRCAVWDGSIAPCSHQNHLIRARPKAASLDTTVMSRWLNSPAGRIHLFQRGKTTSGLNTISVSDVRSTPVPSVSLEQAARLRQRLDQAFTQKGLAASALIELDRVFSSLQHRAFSGQL